MPASTIKPKSSFQRLRQRVGLASDKDKNLPPPPPLAVDTAAAARASGESTKDDTIRAPASSAPRGPIPKLDVRHSSEVSQPSLSGGAVSDTTGGGNNANPLPSPRHSLSRPTPMPTSPTTTTTPQPEQHTMLFKKSNPLMRMTSRLIPNSKRGIAATPPPPAAAEQRAPAKPILNLTMLHKASQREMEEAEEVARVRREEALRARGLRPARAAKPLSEMEAEECRKVGVVELLADGPSEAAALADTWRAQNANGSGICTVDEHGFTGRPSSPTAATPPRESAENPPSPPSARSRRSADGPSVATLLSPSRVPSSSSPAAVIQLLQAPDSTEKVARWLRDSPARATVGSHDVNIEEAKTELAAEATEDDGGPRPESSSSPSSAEASASVEPESTDQDHEDDSCEHDVDPVESLASPVSPVTRTLSDASHLAPPPLSPIIPSSSSEASHTTSIEPVTPSTTSGSLRTRGFSAARGGMAPVIVETAEENILRDERGILASPEATEFGKLPSVPESTPVTSSPTHLRPPGKGKGERRSLGFLFGKSPSRSATLAHPPMPPPPPMPAPKSMGDLRRGMTLSVPSRTKKPAAVHSPTSTSAPATPLAPTMHSHGSIVTGVQYIDDEESRRLSELAFVC